MSDSPVAPSGFGNVTRFVCAGLAARGHTVSILGWQARGSPQAWQNCTIYPVPRNNFGADVLLPYLQRLQPDLLVTLADIWWLTFIRGPALASFMRTAGIPWVLYYPVDGDIGDGRLPPSWVQVLRSVDLPIAMSVYGVESARVNGIASAYIPHGVDTKLFHPPKNKEAAKRALGYQGRFVVLSDARNQPRKMLPRTLEIFRRFARGKDDVLLHLHCDPNDPAARAPEYHYSLLEDIELLGISHKVRLTEGMTIDGGVPLSGLAAIYQAADVHLLSSWGEGFGLPTLQAAAAGAVPMACEYTTSLELTAGHGEPVRIRRFLPDQFGIRRALVDIDDAVEKLERLYVDRELLAERSAASARFAQGYDWERIVPQWQELIQREGARLRMKARYAGSVSRVTLGARGDGAGNTLARTLRSALPDLPDGVRVTVDVVENKAGQLTGEVLRDAWSSDHCLTIPVTLPATDSARRRVIGCVYVAGPDDVPVLRTLSRVFPGLNAWSSAPLPLGPDRNGRPVVARAVARGTSEWTRYLAASVLALDLGSLDPELPARAAEFEVPCIGSCAHPIQEQLWPELTLTPPEPLAAARLARDLLTDQDEAAAICARARERLAAPDVECTEMRSA